MQINRGQEVSVDLESGGELEMLGFACWELAHIRRNNPEAPALGALCLEALRASSEGVEPRRLTLEGHEAVLAISSISLWANLPHRHLEKKSDTYQQSLRRAQEINDNQLMSSSYCDSTT
jgi:hypothetical protein